MKKSFDIIIVGGGMVGATLALALSKIDYQIALVEAYPPQSQSQPSFDDRSIALSYGSIKILQSLNLWESLQPFATAIEKILVVEKGQFHMHRIDAQQRQVPFLGQVICNRDCGKVLWEQLKQQQNIHLLCPARVTELESLDAQSNTSPSRSIFVDVDGSNIQLSANLIIATDGAMSKMRQIAGITHQAEPYSQAAIIANLQTQIPHNGLAIERFTATGPLALLPLKNRWAMVWMVKDSQLQQILDLSDDEFIAQLQPILGQRLGRISRIGKRDGYPLQRIAIDQLYTERFVVAGNAAHHVHPVSGQGFNLGLRDVAWLCELLVKSKAQNSDPGTNELLKKYQQLRMSDIKRTLAVTDALARWFANPNALLKLGRNLALGKLSLFHFADNWLSETAMGLQAPLPRLACGLNIEDIFDDISYES